MRPFLHNVQFHRAERPKVRVSNKRAVFLSSQSDELFSDLLL